MENTSKNNSVSRPRITVIDALRGFALLGVILVHVQQHYSYYSMGPFEPHDPLFTQWNESISWLTRNVLMGRFINIFAFLFGMSFFIQMDSAARKGISFGGRFLWRMVVLFVIGIIGSCFYSGDILSIYAVFGVILLFFNRFKNWVLILMAVLLLIGTPKMIMVGYDQLTRPAQTEQVVSNPTPRPRNNNQRVAPEERPKPSFARSVKDNLTSGLEGKLNYQFTWGNRGYITLAVFFLGLVVGRIRFFETVHLHKRRNWILLAVFAASIYLVSWLATLLPESESMRSVSRAGGVPSITTFVMQALSDVNMVLLSGAITMAFIVLYQIPRIGKVLNVLAPYGRMGLTNYVSQSVIGALLFAMWGCGTIFGAWQATELFLLGLVIYVLQILASKAWLHYFRYGPLEWLWRSATYLKWQPLLKKD